VLVSWVCSLAVAFSTGVHAGEGADGVPPEPPITDDDRQHWSFRPLIRPALPKVQQADWPRNEIDVFILAGLESVGLEPMPPADRATWLRRATFRLIGLPPSPEELDRFVSDDSPGAEAAAIERLLASPAYGEQWGLHWLDLARFAETDGFEHDKPRPDAWRYRDWVIDALNDDLPYDEFIRLQLAGDELRPGDQAAAIATGFVLCGPDMPDINLQDERRHMVLNEITETVGAVFLGLQIGCAACHNHKYDPISQADFYRLRAVFEPAIHFQPHELGRVLHEKGPQAATARLMIRGDFRRPGPELPPAFPRIANPWGDEIPSPPEGATTTRRRTALAAWLTRSDHPLVARVMVNRIWQQHFGRGLSETPSDLGLIGDVPSHPELLDWLASELISSGWSLKHVHRQIVSSATFAQASRPDSADWAADLRRRVQESWRQSLTADPANVRLSRMNLVRLQGEEIRDALLSASGVLSQRRGGPGVMPPLPQELVSTLLKDQWTVSPDPRDHNRRSIYLFVRRNLRHPLLDVFDRPDTIASCPRRARSTTAPQALALLNSELSLQAAKNLAGLLVEEAPDSTGQVRRAYLRVLGRSPQADELAAGRTFLADQAARLKSQGRAPSPLPLPGELPPGADPHKAAALVLFCLALFNLNEFVYVG
jgi:hypothetical protein